MNMSHIIIHWILIKYPENHKKNHQPELHLLRSAAVMAWLCSTKISERRSSASTCGTEITAFHGDSMDISWGFNGILRYVLNGN